MFKKKKKVKRQTRQCLGVRLAVEMLVMAPTRRNSVDSSVLVPVLQGQRGFLLLEK